jgi:hypothetical protein
MATTATSTPVRRSIQSSLRFLMKSIFVIDFYVNQRFTPVSPMAAEKSIFRIFLELVTALCQERQQK